MSIFSIDFKLPSIKIKSILKFFKLRIILYSPKNLVDNIYIRPRVQNSTSFDLNDKDNSPTARIYFEIINASPIKITLKQLTFDLIIEDKWIFHNKNRSREKEIKPGDVSEIPIPSDLNNSQIEMLKEIKDKYEYGKLGKAIFYIDAIFVERNKSYQKKASFQGMDYQINLRT